MTRFLFVLLIIIGTVLGVGSMVWSASIPAPSSCSSLIQAQAAVIIPYNILNYPGFSPDYTQDGSYTKYRLNYAQMKPAMELAFQKSVTQFCVNWTRSYQLYQPCAGVGKIAYQAKKITTEVMRAPNPPDLFVGPTCHIAFAGVTSMVYPVAVLTAGTTLYDTLEMYPTAYRCNYACYTQWSGFLELSRMNNWTNFVVFFDSLDGSSNVMANSLIARMGLAGYTFFQVSVMATPAGKAGIPALLDTARTQGRIFIILSTSFIREVMLIAATKNMTSSEYVYFSFDPFPFTSYPLGMLYLAPGVTPHVNNWKQGLPNDDILRVAYRSLFFFALSDSSTLQEYKDLEKAAKAMANTSFYAKEDKLSGQGNYDGTNYSMNYFSAATYDCILIYAQALETAIRSGFQNFPGSYNRTDLVQRFIYNSTLLKGATGTVRLKGNGDREENFVLWGMTDNTGNYSIVGNFSGTTMVYQVLPNMVWPTPDNTPPLNVPLCGYDGTKGNCIVTPMSFLVKVGVGLAVPAGFFLLLLLVLHYQRIKMEDKKDKAWIARWKELKVIRPGGASANFGNDEDEDESDADEHASLNKTDSAKVTESEIVSSENQLVEKELEPVPSQQKTFLKLTINTGFWKGQAVTLRWSKKRRVKLTREALRQAREVMKLAHEQIMLFKGACVEDDHILIIYENCSKGPLMDLINDQNLKLDWALRFSLMSDCMKGMSYLHKSSLHVHGRLTSMCCYVDSRFVLKVGDYGLDVFFELTIAELWAAKREPEYLLAQLWKAPEHLKAEADSRYEVISSVSPKGDVYSFAIIVQEIFLRTEPFGMYSITKEEIIDGLKLSATGEHPRVVPIMDEGGLPIELVELCDQCWSLDPTKRPNMVQVRAKLKELGRQLGMGERSNILDTLLQQMEDMELNLEAIIEDKGQTLLEEKNRSDQLLFRILPQDVAEKMKNGQKPKAENYELVSLMHCDIPQCNTMIGDSTAMQIVELLNDLSEFYENAVRKHIAYIVDSFKNTTVIVSIHREHHAREVARIALRLLFTISRFRIKHRPQMRLTICAGFHSGPAMGGIVGAMVPRYLLFGDTVSVSSQMSTGSEEMKIQLSLTSKIYLEADDSATFTVSERGEVFVKGKGAMKTYWLLAEPDNPELEQLRVQQFKQSKEDDSSSNALEEEESTDQ